MSKVVLAVGILVLLYEIYQVSQDGSSGNLNQDDLTKWALAIQTHEGWFSGSPSQRNNNPGNLKGTGDLGSDAKGFAVYSSYDKGFAALQSDLSAKANKYPGYSILQIMTRYLGGDPSNPQVTAEGNPFTYAKAVADALGASVSDTLASIFKSGSVNV